MTAAAVPEKRFGPAAIGPRVAHGKVEADSVGMIDQRAIGDLIQWMVEGGRPSASAQDIVRSICDVLVGAGVPIDRFALFIYTLDPNIVGRRYAWTPGEGVKVSEGRIGLFSSQDYLANPLPDVYPEEDGR